MRALIVILALVAGAVLAVPAALADPNDPQKRFTPGDQKLARGIVVTQADLPGTGWKGSRSPSQDNSPLSCAGFAPNLSDLVETGRAEGLDFERADALVFSLAGIFRTEAMARAAFTRVSAPGLVRCVRSASAEGFANEGLEVQRSTLRRSPVPNGAGLSRSYRLEFVLAAGGQTLKAVWDIVLLRRDRALVALTTLGIGKPFPAASLNAIARAVASRMGTT